MHACICPVHVSHVISNFYFSYVIFYNYFIITKFASELYRKRKTLKRYIPYIPVCVCVDRDCVTCEPSHVFSGVNISARAGTVWVLLIVQMDELHLNSFLILFLIIFFFFTCAQRVEESSFSFIYSYLSCRMRWSGDFFFSQESWLLKSLEFCGAVQFFLYLCSSCKSLIKAQYRQYVEVM